MKQFVFIYLLVFIAAVSWGQDAQHKIDSLKTLLRIVKDDKKVVVLNELAYSISSIDPVKGTEYANLALDLAVKKSNKTEIGNSLFNLGTAQYHLKEYDNAIGFYKRSLAIRLKLKDNKPIAKTYHGIGLCYYRKSDYTNALSSYQKALEFRLKLGDKLDIANSYNAIGTVFMSLEYNEKARLNFNNALAIFKEIGFKPGLSNVYFNLGAISSSSLNVNLDKFKSDSIIHQAISFYEKALVIRQELNNKSEIAQVFNALGTMYRTSKDYKKASLYSIEAININQEIGNKLGLSYSLGNMAVIKDSLKQYNESVTYYLKSLAIAEQIEDAALIEMNAKGLTKVYESLGDYKKSLKYIQLQKSIHDSIFNEQKHRQFSELETEYETKKKEDEIKSLNKDKKTQQIQIRNQRYLISAAVVIIVIIIASAILLLRLLRQIRKTNQTLEIVNEELAEQKKAITDSIVYAKRIQNAVLPAPDFIKNLLGEHFVLYKPRDIVSGDFYWVSERDGKIIIAIADCTGHGVPGAFMSMIGITFLNEIVNDMGITMPSLILNHLRDKVITSLKQTGKEGEAKDGMDITLITYDKQACKIQYAGANNPLYLIRNKELLETKADKMPIGIQLSTIDMRPFTNHEIPILPNDAIYLFSDGYVDQIGGPRYKKFLSKRMKELLIEIQINSHSTQKEILDKTIEDWRGDFEQLDDILVFGLKL